LCVPTNLINTVLVLNIILAINLQSEIIIQKINQQGFIFHCQLSIAPCRRYIILVEKQ